MGVYYYQDSSGVDTNLQLYSLKQAAAYWNNLSNQIDSNGEESLSDLKEQIVFILSALGLSLTQLLGQNWSVPDKEKIDDPDKLLGYILECSHLDREKRTRLKKGFANLLRYYGAARHFGRNKDYKKYKDIDDLSIDVLKSFIKTTLEIWDAVINIQRGKDGNELDEWVTVRSKVHFIGFVQQTDWDK